MPIKVDFSALQAAADRIGGDSGDWVPEFGDWVLPPIERELREGKEIKLEDLENSEGLLSYKGRQVLLYIPDQGMNIDSVLIDGGKGKKFHVADCKTLNDMKARGRFERYLVTNDLSGSFKVHGTSASIGSSVEDTANLIVCQNCLEHLNYQGFRSKSWPDRRQSALDFSIGDFFERYSSFFKHLPRGLAKSTWKDAGYSDDWKSVSDKLRRTKGYQCEECGVKLETRKDLIHVHHKNGVKSDNTPSNLQVLCKLCHGQAPMHDHMFISHEERKLISEARQRQGLNEPADWTEVFELADPGLHGILHLCKEGNYKFPEIGLDIQDSSGAVVAYLDLAWPKDKVGIAIAAEDRASASAQGWTVYSPIEGLDEESGPVARR